MLVMPLPIVTEVKLVLLKALCPIPVKLFGIVTEVKLSHQPKAISPILVKSLANLITPFPSLYVLETIVGRAEVLYGVTILPSELVYQISLLVGPLGTKGSGSSQFLLLKEIIYLISYLLSIFYALTVPKFPFVTVLVIESPVIK